MKLRDDFIRFVLTGLSLMMAVLFISPIQADDLTCPDHDDFFQIWLDTLNDQMANRDTYILFNDPMWRSVASLFAEHSLNYANRCGDTETDYSYKRQTHIKNSTFSELEIHTEISSIDVNSDDINEWLIKFRLGDFVSGRGFLYLLYSVDGIWMMKDIWAEKPTETKLYWDMPTSVYVHGQVDTLGRTYMGIYFRGGDPYVNSLRVLRWQDWEFEEVVEFPPVCVNSWEVNPQGLLYITVNQSILFEGCSIIPNHYPAFSTIIPDAQMLPD